VAHANSLRIIQRILRSGEEQTGVESGSRAGDSRAALGLSGFLRLRSGQAPTRTHKSRFLAALGMTRIIPACLFGEEVVEGSYRGEFVVFDVEDGVELGDMEDVVDFLGEVEELELAAGVTDGGEAADQFSNPGTIDVVDADEVEDDLLLALGDEIADGIAEIADFFAKDDAAVDVEDGDVSNFASVNLQRHNSGRYGRWPEW
jgi:hypothetical protein